MKPETSLADDMKLLSEAVREAGKVALSFFGASPETQKKQDGTSVSEADHAANDILHDTLMSARPGYGWLSEESTDDKSRLNARHVWIIDPIDGTRAFLDHKPEWAVSAALVDDGKPLLGIVFNPATNEWFEAQRGRGATLNGKKISVSTNSQLENASFVGSKSLFKKDFWSKPWPQVNSRWANSIAYRLALVANGTADATLTHTPKNEWDMAAAALIVEEAGGRVSTFDGTTLEFNRDKPIYPNILAASSSLYPELLERTKTIDWNK